MDYVQPGTAQAGRDRATQEFARAHGRSPQVVGRAPGRVNLIGEHTDYNGGLCLPLTLPHATWAAVAERGDDRVRIASTADTTTWEGTLAEVGSARGWAAYVAGVVWALEVDTGLDIMVHSTVPIGSGLSSSAALECSVAVAIDHLAGRDLDHARRQELVTACVRAETEVAGAPTGGLDQSAALLAPTDGALLVDFGRGHTRPVPFPLTADGLELLVIDTGVHHSLASSEYGVRRQESQRAAEQLGVANLGQVGVRGWERLDDPTLSRRARHQVTENARVRSAVDAIERRDWTALGELFGASHASLRDDYQVSCEELDVTVEAAADAGALGARMTGGGFGGSAIALVPAERVDEVAEAVQREYADRGWSAPTFLEAGGPSDPAGVVQA